MDHFVPIMGIQGKHARVHSMISYAGDTPRCSKFYAKVGHWHASIHMPVYAKPEGVDSHMKVTGMLVVSFRGVNYRFWYRLGCSAWNADIFSHCGII